MVLRRRSPGGHGGNSPLAQTQSSPVGVEGMRRQGGVVTDYSCGRQGRTIHRRKQRITGAKRYCCEENQAKSQRRVSQVEPENPRTRVMLVRPRAEATQKGGRPGCPWCWQSDDKPRRSRWDEGSWWSHFDEGSWWSRR